jgi:hypothetical protein
MSKRPIRRALTAVLAVGILLAGAMNLRAAVLGAPALPTVEQLVQNVLPGLDKLVATALPQPSTSMEIGVGLAPSDPNAEEQLYSALYDPSSPLYHQFLTPAEVAQAFGASAAQVSSAESWLRSGGLTIDSVGAGGTLIDARGTVADLDRLLGTSVRAFHAGSTSFLANATAPSVPSALGVVSILGLNTLQHFSTPNTAASAATARTTVADGPTPTGVFTGSYTPQQLQSLYEVPASDQGQGQSMAIFGEGNSAPVIANLRRFEQLNNLPQVPVAVKDVGAGPWTDNSGEPEWDLDTQASTGMAPDVSKEVLYFGSSLSDAQVATMFSAWVSDPNGPRQASASFGECETDPLNGLLESPLLVPQPTFGQQLGDNLEPVAEQILLQATLEGRTLFSSTGDTGSSCPLLALPIVGAGNGVLNQVLPLANYPAASDYAVAVGGTVLYSQAGTQPMQRSLEMAWPFTGGGSAMFIPEPAFQKKVAAVNHPCIANSALQLFALGTICRGLPDVAALSGDESGNGYTVVTDMLPGSSGGTSLASPLWLGMWTDIQAAAPDQAHGLGFADELLYAKGTGPNYDKDFHDITVGVNGLNGARPGWDYVSGFGTPDVTNLMTDIDGTTVPASSALAAAVPAPPVAAACTPAIVTPAGNASDPITATEDSTLDLTGGEIDLTSDGKDVRTVLTLAELTGTVPSVGTGADYYTYWTYAGTTWFTEASIGRLGDVSYRDGHIGAGAVHTDAGRIAPGENGTVEVDVPLANVGNPPLGARLQLPYAQTVLELGAVNQTVDAGSGPDDAAAVPCASAPPAPAAPAQSSGTSLPVVGSLPIVGSLPVIGSLPLVGGLGLSTKAPATPSAPAAPAAPGLHLDILGIPITLGGSAPAASDQSGEGLLEGLLHLL